MFARVCCSARAHAGATLTRTGSLSPAMNLPATPADYKRSLKEVAAEAAATAERIRQLQQRKQDLQQEQQAMTGAWQQLQQQQEQLRQQAANAAAARWVASQGSGFTPVERVAMPQQTQASH